MVNGKQLIRHLWEKYSLVTSWPVIKRVLRQIGFTWRRIRKSLKSQRDEQMFAFFQQEIKHLRAMETDGALDLWFYDETGFSLNSNVPYGWLPKASTFQLPAQRGNVLTVAGFIRTNQAFEAYYAPTAMNAELFIAYMEDFILNKVTKKTVVILDRASFHTANIVKAKIEEWKERELYLQFLPAYCSELNLIEMLWRFIKHYWLPVTAYQSTDTLKEHVIAILQNIGIKYRINFT